MERGEEIPEAGHPPVSADAASAPLDLLETDSRLLTLERESSRHARHLGAVEGSLSTQMVSLAVLELCFALFLAIVIWVEYRRSTTTTEEHRGSH